MDSSLPGSSVHGDSPGENTGVGRHALLQGIFPTQGSKQVSCVADGFFTVWATREAVKASLYWYKDRYINHWSRIENQCTYGVLMQKESQEYSMEKNCLINGAGKLDTHM